MGNHLRIRCASTPGYCSQARPVPTSERSERIEGFTLIELLAAMGILIVIVLMMSRIFAETTSMWNLGTRRVTSATEGRVIMDFLVREMSMAMADEHVKFKVNSDEDIFYVPPGYTAQSWTTYGAQVDEVAFIAMMRPGSSSWRRTANQFVYFVAPMLDVDRNEMPGRYRLVRTRRTTTVYNNAANRALGPYQPADSNVRWWEHMEPDWYETDDPALRALETIAENVAAFEVWAWAYDTQQERMVNIFSYESYHRGPEDTRPQYRGLTPNTLPLWVDIFIEMLGEADAERAAILWVDGDQQAAEEFVHRNARRYTARVHFPNRERALAFRETP